MISHAERTALTLASTPIGTTTPASSSNPLEPFPEWMTKRPMDIPNRQLTKREIEQLAYLVQQSEPSAKQYIFKYLNEAEEALVTAKEYATGARPARKEEMTEEQKVAVGAVIVNIAKQLAEFKEAVFGVSE